MIQIVDKTKCCGCTACYNICPEQALEMKADSEGFYYPEVKRERCTNCKLCEKVCPVLNKKEHEEITKGYIVRHKDSIIVNQSTSGGAFTAVASYLVGQGAVVYGAGYDDRMQVVCKRAEKYEQLGEMRGSKFVQSSLGTTYIQIKNELHEGKVVLFTGTPCQVSGLITFLGTKPDNLLCIDFVCRGVPSPGLWKNYVSMMEEKYASKMIDVKFKHKTYGYHTSTMKIVFENGKIYYGSGRIDPYMKAFVKELSSRPSCSACLFKEIERLSDITLFDCYKFSEITDCRDDDKGYTSILIHTNRGRKIFNEIKNSLWWKAEEIDKLVNKNGIMILNSAQQHPKRREFYEMVESMPIDKAIEMICPITKKDFMIERAKSILFKTGLIRIARKIKRKQNIRISV